MERDLRSQPLYKEVEAYFTALYQPGTSWVSDGCEATVSPDGRWAAFTGDGVQRPALGPGHAGVSSRSQQPNPAADDAHPA